MSETPPSRFRRVLVLAAHTDDEFGCAGAMTRFVGEGAEVRYLAMSACEESVPPPFPRSALRGEAMAACCLLGVSRVTVGRERVRHFPQHRQRILERFVEERAWPDLVLCPNSEDHHQDHHVVYEEAVRAFTRCTVLGYELPQNLRLFKNTAWVTLTRQHVEAKVQALGCYLSQADKPYADPEVIAALARVRGVQAGSEYAEAYEVIRWIL